MKQLQVLRLRVVGAIATGIGACASDSSKSNSWRCSAGTTTRSSSAPYLLSIRLSILSLLRLPPRSWRPRHATYA
jgi:hypothetical protein